MNDFWVSFLWTGQTCLFQFTYFNGKLKVSISDHSARVTNKLPEGNIHDWCAPGVCAGILRAQGSRPSPCSHTLHLLQGVHHTEHTVQLQGGPLVHANTLHSQCSKLAAWHLETHWQPWTDGTIIQEQSERQGTKKDYNNNSLHFCEVVINQAEILNMCNFANITSQFSVNAVFAIVDLQTAIHFNVHVTMHCNKFCTIKPTSCTNFSILFWKETLHVSDSSSVHHQEYFTVHTAMVYVILVCCVYSEILLMMDRGTVWNMQSFIPK